MEVRACKECRRLFNYLSGEELCPQCKEKLEEKFQEVKEYMREHQNVVMKQIAKDCDVTITQIKNWIRENRLLLVADGEDAFPRCKNCGKAVRSGNLCNLCKRDLLYDLGNALEINKQKNTPKKKKNTPKMRFLDR